MAVVTLKGVEIADSGARSDVVDFLEDLLASAKRGEIKTLAVVGIMPNLEIFTRSAGELNKHLMLAGAFYLQHDLAASE